jgi:hypothetical protein
LTFKDLKKRLSLEIAQQSRLFERIQNKPFWIRAKEQHKLEDIRTDGDCCFNHNIGLPQKEGVYKPLYGYQKIIFDSLVTQDGNVNSSNKHLWIKKATGLGMSNYSIHYRTGYRLVYSSSLGEHISKHV